MIVKRIRSFRSLCDFLQANKDILKKCGFDSCPSHDTLARRYKGIALEIQSAIKKVGNIFIQEGVINPKYVAGDAKLFHAKKNDSQKKQSLFWRTADTIFRWFRF
jgi:transposase